MISPNYYSDYPGFVAGGRQMDRSKAEAARYIAELAMQLGRLANDHGMSVLAERLWEAAARATEIAEEDDPPGRS
jgi:hypothetical protein